MIAFLKETFKLGNELSFKRPGDVGLFLLLRIYSVWQRDEIKWNNVFPSLRKGRGGQ
jgi:hypothetical protein